MRETTSSPTPLDCDLLIVGGGVNGAGIARDAAGRGLSVVLCEQDDLASHTSSSSTKLIHGGLRYLEHYEFSLVRKSLLEREVLLGNAPHIMWPLRFVLPHDPSMRPAWMMRLGLFFYDHLARRELLAGSEGIDLRRHAAGGALKPEFTKAFVYSDGWVDDARLVVLNAVGAAEKGATILPRTTCVRAVAAPAEAGGWMATLREADGATCEVHARALVNATGQWAASFLQDRTERKGTRSLRLIKGSHIVVPRMFDHDMAYILQSPDKRIVFAIPYETDFTLVGTTDVEQDNTPGKASISDAEIEYLCGLINRYFRQPIRPQDVVWSYSGVRPLMDDESGDPSAITRDYSLELVTNDGPPCLTVWGGKITTYRKLAEEAVDLLHPVLSPRVQRMEGPWTIHAPLPGGDFRRLLGDRPAADLGFEQLCQHIHQAHAWLPDALVKRYARSYGTLFARVIGTAASVLDLGEEVAPGLYAAELTYLCDHEWARTADDVLWRRSKLGLHFDETQRQAVADWLAAHAEKATA